MIYIPVKGNLTMLRKKALNGPVQEYMRALILIAALLPIAGASGKTLNGFELDDPLVPAREIVGGGPPRDGIPALKDPAIIRADQADYLDRSDRVLGVVIDGSAKAYPVKILDWHEVVNDRIGSRYFIVTYCPLCGSGMVFDTSAGDDRLVFGVSGLLYNSDVLLFDRNTGSLWSQLMAKAINGELKGTDLPQLPALHTTWQAWRERHPETTVLSEDTGYRRNYNRSPYINYDKSRQLFFDVSERAPTKYHPKELVLGIKSGESAKAYPFTELESTSSDSFVDQFDGNAITVFWDDKSQTAWAEDSEGEPVPATVAYWFAWYAFNPDTLVYEAQPQGG